MKDVLMIFCFVGFLAFGVMGPFVLALGYVWVDIFYPQYISPVMFRDAPVGMFMGVLTILSYVVMDRKSPPRATLLLGLYFCLAAWITFTTSIAVEPIAAAQKFDPSIKVLLFAAFIPFIFRSRVQIEAFLQVLIFSACAHILPWGIKTLVSGGGYGKSLGLLGSNAAALSESSMIANFCFTCVPLFLVLAKHNLVLPWKKYHKPLFYGLAGLFSVAAIGTFARTGLVALAVMLMGFFVRSKHKLRLTILAMAGLAGLAMFTSSSWTTRMSTVADYQDEGSAETRILVWKWTWDFVQEHPLGGGFNAFYTQRIEIPGAGPDGGLLVVAKRAFHSIYFAVLGEHGFPGLAMYLSILGLSVLALQKTRTLLRGNEDHLWCYDMAGALQIGLVTFLAGAAFIDVSFNQVLWDLLALAICLREYAARVARAAATANTMRLRLAENAAANW